MIRQTRFGATLSHPHRLTASSREAAYFNWVEIEEKVS
jgi:hypothetical protein